MTRAWVVLLLTAEFGAVAAWVAGRDLVAHYTGLLLLPLLAWTLVLTDSPESSTNATARRSSLDSRCLAGCCGFAAVLLVLPPTTARELNRISSYELWALAGLALLLAAVFCILLAGVRRGPATVLLILILLAAVSIGLHYNLSYDVGMVPVRNGLLDLGRNLRMHVLTLALGAALLVGVPWVLRRVEPMVRRMPPRSPRSRARAGLTLGLICAVAGCVFALLESRKAEFGYVSRGLFIPALVLPLLGRWWPGSRLRGGWRVLVVLLLAATFLTALGVDVGVGSIIASSALLLSAYLWLTDGIRESRARVAPFVVGLVPAGLALLAPLLVFGMLSLEIELPMEGLERVATRFRERALTMFYPGHGEEPFVQQMFAAQLLMREAVAYGGVFGDAFWGNAFYLPQVNTDMAVAALFHYHGLFGYATVLVFGALLAQLAKLALRKDFARDREEAVRFGALALGVFLLLALPALWVLGGLSLWLPWTGVVFPLLSRGLWYHLALALLLGFVIYFEGLAFDHEPSARQPVEPRRRALRYATVAVLLIGALYSVSLFTRVHLPLLKTRDARAHYVEIPENEPREQEIRVGGPDAGPLEFRVGNAQVRRQPVPALERRFLDDFVYVSEFRFSRDETAQPITVGREGSLSPVLALPWLARYVHKRHHAVLFWERVEGSLRLRVIGDQVRVIDHSLIPPAARLLPEGDRPLVAGDMLRSGEEIRVGSTRMRVSLDDHPDHRLRLLLEPDTAGRAQLLLTRGAGFRLSRSRRNVLGGLQLAAKNIDRRRATVPWTSTHDRQVERGTLRDRTGRSVLELRGDVARYADPNLAYLLGLHRRVGRYGRAFGLDFVLDPVLSGHHRLGTIRDATRRTLRAETVRGDEVVLTLDLERQRRLTAALNRFGAGADADAVSAVMLTDANEIVALGQFARDPRRRFVFRTESLSSTGGWVALPVDSQFEAVFQRIDRRATDPNPLLREPLVRPLVADLPGSVIKGVFYTEALAEHFDRGTGHVEHFFWTANPRTSFILGLDGDHVNTRQAGGRRLFSAACVLRQFGRLRFPPIHNYGTSCVATDLRTAFGKSSNTAGVYMAIRLGGTRDEPEPLRRALRRFGFESALLLRSTELDGLINPSSYVKAEPVRYASGFSWSNVSDVARMGIGDKLYVSLLHLATFYSTILVNDGDFIHPTIVLRVGNIEVEKIRYPTLPEHTARPTLRVMQELASAVVAEGGTAAAFARELRSAHDVRVIGAKTGTASIGSETTHDQIFVAVVEVGRERYTLATRVDNTSARTNLAVTLAAHLVHGVLRDGGVKR